MTTYTITINEKTEIGKGILALLKKLGYIPAGSAKSNAINESIADINAGRVHTAINAKDLISKCLK